MAPPTVRILSRYVLRQHLAPLGFALGALTALMLLNQVAKQFGNLVGKGLPATVIAEVFVLSVPFIMAVTLPMAVLVAVLHAFTRLGGDNEITALQAGGIGVRHLLRPVLGGAAVVSLLSLLWSDQVLPRANHRLRTLLTDIQRKKPSFTLKEQVINEIVRDQFFLRAARIDQASSRLKDVTIYDLQDPERRRIISADSGRMAFTPDRTDLYLTLLDGEIHEVRRGDPAQFNRTFFRVNRIRVAGVSNIFDRTEEDAFRGDRELSICAMELKVAEARRAEAHARLEAQAAVVGDLRRLAGLRPLPPPSPPPPLPDHPDSAAREWRGRGGWSAWYCAATSWLAGLLVPRAAGAAGAQTLGEAPRTAITLTTGAGVTEQQRVRSARQRAAMYEVEIQKKYAIAAACLVFALVGVPIALWFPRGGTGLVLATSVVVFSVYYVGLIGGEELGDRLVVSPFLAMWLPNLIFSAVGIAGLWLVERTGISPRGATWQDVVRAVRRRPR
ncbi:MAG TPA: LptF/LptG family permease [Gemmatimonadales bacterium]|nr:LptF/LptG family permease [Gemmatimonadales bacterium]